MLPVIGLSAVLLGVGLSAAVLLCVGLSVVLFTNGLAGLALRKLFTACRYECQVFSIMSRYARYH